MLFLFAFVIINFVFREVRLWNYQRKIIREEVENISSQPNEQNTGTFESDYYGGILKFNGQTFLDTRTQNDDEFDFVKTINQRISDIKSLQPTLRYISDPDSGFDKPIPVKQYISYLEFIVS